MISFVVKGTLAQAVLEARRMGVEVKSGYQIETGERRVPECCLWAEDDQENSIALWFCQHSELIPGKGYPIGTCLIYSHHPEVTAKSAVQLRYKAIGWAVPESVRGI